MKPILFPTIVTALMLLVQPIQAQTNNVYPSGDITIRNASPNNVTAQVSDQGKFTLAANESKTVAYSALSKVCSSTPTRCRTQFYVNDVSIGSAAINVETGKLVYMNLSMDVSISKSNNVIRSIVIK